MRVFLSRLLRESERSEQIERDARGGGGGEANKASLTMNRKTVDIFGRK